MASAAPVNFNQPKELLASEGSDAIVIHVHRTDRKTGREYRAVPCGGEMYRLWGGFRALRILSVAPDTIHGLYVAECRSQWPRGLTRRSVAARLLRLWVRIPPGARMFVCCECCVLSGRVLCDELIPRPEESYRL